MPIAAVVLASVFITAQSAAASASGYLDEATQGLQSSPVYVSAQVGELNSAQQAEIVSEIGSMDIAIVVLPAGAKSEIGDIPSFISGVANRTGYDTVLVSIGGDFEAGSSVLPSGEASSLANEAQGASTLADGLSQFVEGVESAGVAAPPASNGGGEAFNPTGIFVGVGGGLVLVVAAVASVMLVRKRRQQPASRSRAHKVLRTSYNTPQEVKELLNQIEDYRQALRNESLASSLKKVLQKDVHEFFVNVRKYMPTRIQEMTGQYKVHLTSVLGVLEGYVYAEEHPEYVKNSEAQKRTYEDALGKFQRGVILNIQEARDGAVTKSIIDTKMLDAMVRGEEPDYLAAPTPEPIPVATDEPKKRKRS